MRWRRIWRLACPLRLLWQRLRLGASIERVHLQAQPLLGGPQPKLQAARSADVVAQLGDGLGRDVGNLARPAPHRSLSLRLHRHRRSCLTLSLHGPQLGVDQPLF